MIGSTYEGEFFLVTLCINPADPTDTDNYSVLARNADEAIQFAKGQTTRDGYVYAELRGLTILAGPDYVAGDVAGLLEEILFE